MQKIFISAESIYSEADVWLEGPQAFYKKKNSLELL